MKEARSQKASLGVLFLTVAIDLLGFGMVVPLLPLWARQLSVSHIAIGWLLASYSLMQLVFSPLWGALSDRVGRRPILLFSIAGNAVALALFACADTYTTLLVSRALAGICAANIAVAGAYIADVTPPEERSRRMGFIGAAFGLGFVLGPALAGELSVWHRRAPAFFAATLAALNFLSAFLWLPESLATKTQSARQTFKQAESMLMPWMSRWRILVSAPELWPLLSLIFVQILGFAMMELTLTLFVATVFDFGPHQSGRLLAFVGLTLVLVQGGAIGPATKRFGAMRLVTLGLAAMGMGMAALALSAKGSLLLLFGALCLLGMGQGVVSPSLSALITQRSGAHHFGVGLGLSQSMSALARVLGPLLAGNLIDLYHVKSPLWVGSAIVSCGALGALYLEYMQTKRTLAPVSCPKEMC